MASKVVRVCDVCGADGDGERYRIGVGHRLLGIDLCSADADPLRSLYAIVSSKLTKPTAKQRVTSMAELNKRKREAGARKAP